MAIRKENTEQINLDLYEGNHFQFFIGPTLDPNDKEAESVNAAIERIFQRNNLIRDCIDRHTDALVGKLPTWFFKDSNGDRLDLTPDETTGEVPDSPAALADKLIQKWLDRALNLAVSQDSGLDNPFSEAAKNTAVAGMGYLRLWVPRRFREALDPIQRVVIHCPANDAVEYIYDDDRFLERINYRYTSDDKEYIESQFIDSATNDTVFEIQNDRGDILKDPETGEDQIFRMRLGGRYTIQRMQAPSLITESARDAQNAINFVLTMMIRNLEQAGFLERIILGGLPPGKYVDNPDGSRDYIVSGKFEIGPGKTSFVQGIPSFDRDGNVTGQSSPSMQYRDPVSIETFERSHKVETAILYTQMGQGHLVASDLNMSGIARIQARQDFDRKLEKHRNTAQSAIAGILGAALMMMVDDPAPYEGLDVAVQLRLSTSKPLPEELKENREDYAAKLRSQSTAMSAAGIEDTDAERQLLKIEVLEDAAPNLITQLGTLGQLSNEEIIAALKQIGAIPNSVISNNVNQVLNPETDS